MIAVRDFLVDQQVFRAPDAPKTPTVSVVLPTHSRYRSGQLERAIRSVLRQTFSDLELIVVDDGSRDGSFEFIRSLRAIDPRIVHVRHAQNCGLPGLRVNEGIELARGAFLAFQFDDDCWRPHALDVLIGKMRASSSCCVAVGKAHYTAHTQPGSFILPPGDLSFAFLHEANRMANNAVLVPRALFDRYGMYDCHIGMRRLCDWDLWLRLIRHVDFVLADEIVSEVSVANPGAIGITVPYDLPLFRYFSDIPRDELLTPDRWHEYEVDCRRAGEVDIAPEIWRRLYEEQIVSYYLKFRHFVPAVEGFPSNAPGGRKEVLYFCSRQGPTEDAGLRPYDSHPGPWTAHQGHVEYGDELSLRWRNESEMVLILRPHREDERAVMQQGLASGLPMGVYLDDDFLTLHEYGPPFDFMAPGTANRESLVDMLERTDAVWVTSRLIAESVQPFNRRIVPHGLALDDHCLPARIPPRHPTDPFRIGYVGTSYRVEEFRILWDALTRLSAEYGEGLQFEFWGLDVTPLPPLSSPVRQLPYETSYARFLRRLREARFDILLTPLLDQPRPRLAKNLHKYFYAAVAGALGIFSRVPPYDPLPEGLTCLKAENTASAWYQVLREALQMPPERFELMRHRTLAHVREAFTAAAQIHLHEAAWRATEFHAKTRAARATDGRPRVLLALDALDWELEIRLSRWLGLLRHYGVEPVVALPAALAATPAGQRLIQALTGQAIATECAAFSAPQGPPRSVGAQADTERRELSKLLERLAPALVHTIGFIPVFGELCAAMHLAHVASLYAVTDETEWQDTPPAGQHCAVNHSDSLRYATWWRDRLGTQQFCARELVPQESFDLGLRRHLEALGLDTPPRPRPRRILVLATLREDQGQLEAIAALAHLLRAGHPAAARQYVLELAGDTHGDPEYVARCRARIAAEGLAQQVHLNDAPHDLLGLLASADILLSPARAGSLPLAIKEAMAAGVLVAATPVGGVPELLLDGVSGLLCANPSVGAIADTLAQAIQLPLDERRTMLNQARRVARAEFHPHRAASDLFQMYNRAIDVTRGSRSVPAAPPVPRTAPAPPRRAGRLEQPAHPPASHVRLHGTLTYRLVPHARNWHGVDVLVGTHQQPPRGRLQLTVLSPPGHVLRTSTVDLATARDNDWLRFDFPPIANAPGSPFLLRFSLTDPGPQTKLSLYDMAADAATLTHRALRRLRPTTPRDTLYCRTRYAQ